MVSPIPLYPPVRVTDQLVAEHEHLATLLDRAMAGGTLDAPTYDRFRRELLRHIAVEEKILYPAARRARGTPVSAARELREEHAALTSLLVPTPDVALCREIRALLEVHDAKEEEPGGAYAECDVALDPATSSRLAAEAAAYPAVPVVRYFDGEGTHRTAASALAAARRMRPTRAAG